MVALLWAPFCPFALAQAADMEMGGTKDMGHAYGAVLSSSQTMGPCCPVTQKHGEQAALPSVAGLTVMLAPAIVTDVFVDASVACVQSTPQGIRGPPNAIDHHCSHKRE